MTGGRRGFQGVLFGAVALLAMVASGAAQDAESGRVEIVTRSIAIVGGGGRGDGTLTLPDGRTYKFSVEGFTVASLGVSKTVAEGRVSHMKSVRDFEGNYTVLEAGGSLGAGGGALRMRNHNGVVMDLVATQVGVSLTLGVSGMTVKVKSHLF